jgi:hypothetical protein
MDVGISELDDNDVLMEDNGEQPVTPTRRIRRASEPSKSSKKRKTRQTNNKRKRADDDSEDDAEWIPHS